MSEERNSLFDECELEKPILDLGCGFNESGADIKLDYVTLCAHLKSVANVLGDAHYLPFKDNSLGSIFSTQAFEHFYDIETIVKECYRVLKPKGKILVEVPLNMGGLPDGDLMEINKEILENEGALRYYQNENWVSYRFGKPIVDIHVRICTEELVNSWFVEELWDLLIISGCIFVYEKI